MPSDQTPDHAKVRSMEWWLKRVDREEDYAVGAGIAASPSGGRCKWDDVPCGGEECRATCRSASGGREACRVVEYDGAFKCLTHKRQWGAILNPDEPCGDRSPVAPVPPVVTPSESELARIWDAIPSNGSESRYWCEMRPAQRAELLAFARQAAALSRTEGNPGA